LLVFFFFESSCSFLFIFSSLWLSTWTTIDKTSQVKSRQHKMHICFLRPNFISLFTTLTLVFLRSRSLRAFNWPSGTTARGSTTDPDSRYRSSFAIDGDTDTFWNE
jgi:hypothetical protein